MANKPLEPILTSSQAINRYEKNPVLSKEDIPYEAECIFNAGVVKHDGRYVMVFRNDYGFNGSTSFSDTNLGIAFSDNGIDWEVAPEPFFTRDMLGNDEYVRIYDPRLTVIEDELYICFALDTQHGLRGGIGRVKEDYSGIDIISLSVPDNRNMALFPEKIDGMYVRLERPFPVYSRGKDRFDIWISKSADLKFWGESELVMGVEDVPYANDKIGPAAPPIKTEKGWLTIFHAVDIDPKRGKNGWEPEWKKRYTAGIMLLDLNNPAKVIAMSKLPLISPEAPYEADEGFRENVIFPGGMILEDSGEVKIYYGAADNCECLATANIDELISLCSEKK